MADDVLFQYPCYLFTGLIFYPILWSVKFAFLLLHRKLLSGLAKISTWAWWGILALCVAVSSCTLPDIMIVNVNLTRCFRRWPLARGYISHRAIMSRHSGMASVP